LPDIRSIIIAITKERKKIASTLSIGIYSRAQQVEIRLRNPKKHAHFKKPPSSPLANGDI
jgi:hypothetical protein